jgi:ABC-type phosphate transport system permease subunit
VKRRKKKESFTLSLHIVVIVVVLVVIIAIIIIMDVIKYIPRFSSGSRLTEETFKEQSTNVAADGVKNSRDCFS